MFWMTAMGLRAAFWAIMIERDSAAGIQILGLCRLDPAIRPCNVYRPTTLSIAYHVYVRFRFPLGCEDGEVCHIQEIRVCNSLVYLSGV